MSPANVSFLEGNANAGHRLRGRGGKVVSLDRAPVIVGTGLVSDREEDLSKALDAGRLMQAAIARAGQDAGSRVLERIDSLELVRLFSASMDGVADALASALPGL
jgi:hypothetical protein